MAAEISAGAIGAIKESLEGLAENVRIRWLFTIISTVLTITVSVIIIFMAEQTLSSLSKNEGVVVEASLTRAQIHTMFENILYAATYMRAYVLTGDESYKASYNTRKEIAETARVYLGGRSNLHRDHSQQLQLDELVARKYSQMEHVMDIRSSHGRDDAINQEVVYSGKETLERISLLLDKLSDQQDNRATTAAKDTASTFNSLRSLVYVGLVSTAIYTLAGDITKSVRQHKAAKKETKAVLKKLGVIRY